MSIEFQDDRLLQKNEERPNTSVGKSVVYGIVCIAGAASAYMFDVCHNKPRKPSRVVAQAISTPKETRSGVQAVHLSALEDRDNILNVPFMINGTLPDGTTQQFTVTLIGDGLSVSVDGNIFRFHEVTVGKETFSCGWLESIALQDDDVNVQSKDGIRIGCSMGHVHVPAHAIEKIAVAGLGQKDPKVSSIPYTLHVEGVLGTALRAMGMKEKDECTICFRHLTQPEHVPTEQKPEIASAK